ARRARHGKVEQHEVDVVVAGHDRLGAVEVAGLQDRRDVAYPAQRLLQRTAEKRMIVRDHELVARRQMPLPLRRASWPEWTRAPIMRRRPAFSSDNAGIPGSGPARTRFRRLGILVFEVLHDVHEAAKEA